jgi:hypothetical protein
MATGVPTKEEGNMTTTQEATDTQEGFVDLTIVVSVTRAVADSRSAWDAAAWVLGVGNRTLQGGTLVGCGVFLDAFYEPAE